MSNEWDREAPRILANLRREIPVPIAKPQKSFAGLKPGDRLAQPSLDLTVTVTETTSLGARTDSGLVLGRDWHDHWTKLRRRKAKEQAK